MNSGGILRLFRINYKLSILGGWFILLFLTNTFWVFVLLPWGIFTWVMVAQILYLWASPRWRARFPRVTKSMLKGEISRLNHLVIQKNKVIKGYFKSIVFYQEENVRLRAEIEMLKKEGKVEVTEATPTIN